MRTVRLVGLMSAVLLAGCAGEDEPAPSAAPGAAADVRALAQHFELMHPALHHSLPRARFVAARDDLVRRTPSLSRDELLVELMRFTALAGPRDGHTGIFPLDPGHRRQLHLFPLRLYDFPEGLVVVGQVGGATYLGKRLVAVDGVPVADALAAVRPLVPRDNEHSLRARAPQWLVTAEVLHGLGLTKERLRARFSFAHGESVELAAIPATDYAAAFDDLFHPMVPQGLPQRPQPPFLRHRNEPLRLETLAGGRAVYLSYTVTTAPTSEIAERLTRAAAATGVDRIILDVRHNPGGDNGTFPPLLAALQELPERIDLLVLTSRTTFSAAQNLVADLERTARPRFLGEPTGGSPNLYGDPASLQLPHSGWNVHVATVYWERSRAGDPRTTIEPDVTVRFTAADFLAGRDPVLRRALP